MPRYDPYQPGMQSVYANYDALIEIRCQSCGRVFLVGCCASQFEVGRCEHGGTVIKTVLPTVANPGFVWWGDAPSHEVSGGRCAGNTMSSELVRVVEFWECTGQMPEWTRVSKLEIPLPW